MSYLSKKAATIAPYTAGEQPRDKRYIKLNTNENPYAPSPKTAAVTRGFDTECLRRYPDPEAATLSAAIAKAKGVSPNCVFVGNGSDEVLAMCFAAFFENERVAFADITYSFYPVYAELYGAQKVTVPLVGLLQDAEAYVRADAKGVVIANPNAPTSVAMPLAELIRIAKADPNRLLVVDEAYIDFGGETAAGLVRSEPNVIVVQTFSKSYALAGIRCGYALAQPHLIEGLNRIKNSFNSYTTGFLTQAIAEAALADTAYFEEKRKALIATRTRATNALRAAGYDLPDSATNFLYIKHADAYNTYQKLKERGILVRYFSALPNRLRVTVGTDAETDAFVQALKEIDGK